jgi:putative oligomerization/nucleic acid binding protein
MKELTQEQLRMNEQAVRVAASVVGEPVEAAARCEQATQDMMLEAAGVGAVNRGFVKGAKGLSRVMMPRTMGGMKQMETGGLPNSFVLAATASKVYAIEDKQKGGELVAGKILHEWDRDGFSAKRNELQGMNVTMGLPDDRQLLIIYLSLEGNKSRYMQAAQRQMDAYGSPGQPTRFALAKDEASDKLIAAVTANAPAPGANIMIGGQSLADMQAAAAQAAAGATATHADPTAQLGRLADLRDRGVLSDEEFAAQKAKILGA